MSPLYRSDDYYIIKLTVRLMDDTHQSLMQIARAKNMSMNELISGVLQDYIASQDPDEVERVLREDAERHRRSVERHKAERDQAHPWL